MCEICNGKIGEGKPLCGELVDTGNVVNVVKTNDGYELEMWVNFECIHTRKIHACPECARKL